MPARAPSIALLRALIPSTRPTSATNTPISSHCLRLTQPQSRAKSLWMPRKKYAKVTSLDKLHRRQREGRIQERLNSQTRAQSMTFAPSTPSSSATTTDTGTQPNPLFPPVQQPTSQTTPLNLPYLVSRTPSQQLPVYEQTKASGTKRQTIIRKITGDVAALRAHIHEALGFEGQTYVDLKGRKKEWVRVNEVTRQVVIRGWRGAEVKRWLELGGF